MAIAFIAPMNECMVLHKALLTEKDTRPKLAWASSSAWPGAVTAGEIAKRAKAATLS